MTSSQPLYVRAASIVRLTEAAKAAAWKLVRKTLVGQRELGGVCMVEEGMIYDFVLTELGDKNSVERTGSLYDFHTHPRGSPPSPDDLFLTLTDPHLINKRQRQTLVFSRNILVTEDGIFSYAPSRKMLQLYVSGRATIEVIVAIIYWTTRVQFHWSANEEEHIFRRPFPPGAGALKPRAAAAVLNLFWRRIAELDRDRKRAVGSPTNFLALVDLYPELIDMFEQDDIGFDIHTLHRWSDRERFAVIPVPRAPPVDHHHELRVLLYIVLVIYYR